MKFPQKRKVVPEVDKPVVIGECFCPNGHSLISTRVKFEDHCGLYLKVRNEQKEGFVAISPVCGCTARISFDIDLVKGENYDFFCPECDVQLPVLSPCPSCDSSMITIFRSIDASYNYCFGICSRVGCKHAELHIGAEIRKCLRVRYYDNGKLY